MRNKSLFISAVLLLALALGACSPTFRADAAPPVRTLSVNGTGMAFLSPDIAYIYIGVHTEEPTAADAVEANNAQTQQVIDALQDAGVAANDIRTTSFSIWPNQQYSPDGQPTGTRYVVDNSVFVTVRELEGLGDLLDSAIGAGANSINSIQFDVADKDEALKNAREEAVKDAKEQAQQLADAAGMSLGEVQSISFYDSAPIPYMEYGKGGGGGAAVESAVPIQPGQLAVTATVSISYEIR
ncbi:MAG TPA: SIMPL domain-containing protein [Anaerolineales bacterium]